jgi:hypothetical protein
MFGSTGKATLPSPPIDHAIRRRGVREGRATQGPITRSWYVTKRRLIVVVVVVVVVAP